MVQLATGVFPAANLSVAADRKAWIKARVNQTAEEHLDGINIDIEYPLGKGEASPLTTLVAETTAAFHAANPDYQVNHEMRLDRGLA